LPVFNTVIANALYSWARMQTYCIIMRQRAFIYKAVKITLSH